VRTVVVAHRGGGHQRQGLRSANAEWAGMHTPPPRTRRAPVVLAGCRIWDHAHAALARRARAVELRLNTMKFHHTSF